MKKDHLEIILEDIRGKFDLVLEGHDVLRKEIRDTRQELKEDISVVNLKVEALNQKIDSVDEKLTTKINEVETKLTDKIDAVAADLTAHRRDTEVHKTMYQVKEP